jgi:uncharacterized protein YdaT
MKKNDAKFFTKHLKLYFMPWTKNDYPNSMKNLPDDVRNKAIEIGNALLEEKSMDEGIAIATAISRAKDWAANRGKQTEPSEPNRRTDIKQHGEDRIVSPHGDKGWEVKKEAGKRGQLYDTKEEAVKVAREEAKMANASVTIQGRDGKIEDRISYNPRNRAPDQ